MLVYSPVEIDENMHMLRPVWKKKITFMNQKAGMETEGYL